MITLSEAPLEILADPAALARRVADWLLKTASATSRGIFAVALSGSSTPQPIYRLLAEPPYREAFPWARSHWFWGDERFVPPDDPASNYGMAREVLLARVPIPPGNIHPIPTTGLSPAAAALAYERVLQAFYGADHLDPVRPLFDVNLLGLGLNGHTASLFPGTAVLTESERWVGAVVGATPEPRITLTYPALESSRATIFVVSGAEKRPILTRLRHGDTELPASRLRPTGQLRLFADAAAAEGLR